MERLVDYCRANLVAADFQDTQLRGKNFRGARLQDTNFCDADLRDADLRDTRLRHAKLRDADLRGANLRGAYLETANLRGARLDGAIMPDGRVWEEYRKDPLKGICRTPEARKRAIKAWGLHSWHSCPMRMANGYCDYNDVPEEDRILVEAFVAIYDAWLLDKPE